MNIVDGIEVLLRLRHRAGHRRIVDIGAHLIEEILELPRSHIGLKGHDLGWIAQHDPPRFWNSDIHMNRFGVMKGSQVVPIGNRGEFPHVGDAANANEHVHLFHPIHIHIRPCFQRRFTCSFDDRAFDSLVPDVDDRKSAGLIYRFDQLFHHRNGNIHRVDQNPLAFLHFG